MKWSLLFTFFRSLQLPHLERSLFSMSKQTITPDAFWIYDNNSGFCEDEVKAVIAKHFDLTKVKMIFDPHGDFKKTASYCHNRLIGMCETETFILGRADCIYSFDFCRRLLEVQGGNPMVYSASQLWQMPLYSKASYETVDHAADLEPLKWREDPMRLLQNKDKAQLHYAAEMDSASFCMAKSAWANAGGYDEYLDSWGLWQMSFQTELRRRGVEFKIIPEPLYFHTLHPLPPEEGQRDQSRAHAQFHKSPRRKMKQFQQ